MTVARKPVAALITATTALLLTAGCASDGTRVVRPQDPAPSTLSTLSAPVGAEPPAASAARPCPPPERWRGPRDAPTTIDGTPANTPEAEELSQAVGRQGRGAFAEVYGSLVVDFPVGRVALCVTDLARGRELAKAAAQADPKADVTRLDLYLARYSERRLTAAAKRLEPYLGRRVLGFPLRGVGPAPDASGIEVMTDAAGTDSAALKARLQQLSGGIPVRTEEGNPVAA
ncbi:hypothetical protein [Peterkaempfera griseoplana]|uniref:hypothetical protein n=1 Tax=Peterkaempfera griseoplana TaxID=66896 RepID=UPI0006E20016|nr:hypothetical protein [Peterkaempfera griseoplana]